MFRTIGSLVELLRIHLDGNEVEMQYIGEELFVVYYWEHEIHSTNQVLHKERAECNVKERKTHDLR